MKKLFWRAVLMETVVFWAGASQSLPALGVTPTSNPSASPTATWTAAPTQTFTATPTFTVPFTPTGTLSPSLTPTPTFTLTQTLSPTITATPTHTPTGTLSPVLTSTPTFTITPIHAKAPKYTPTVTPTATSTPGVFEFSVSPQPDASNQVHFKWGTTAPAEHTYMRIFTSGLRPVLVYDFNKDQKPENLTKGNHEVTWDCMDEEGRAMPPGRYICFISITVGKKTYEASGQTEIP